MQSQRACADSLDGREGLRAFLKTEGAINRVILLGDRKIQIDRIDEPPNEDWLQAVMHSGRP